MSDGVAHLTYSNVVPPSHVWINLNHVHDTKLILRLFALAAWLNDRARVVQFILTKYLVFPISK